MLIMLKINTLERGVVCRKKVEKKWKFMIIV